MSEAGGKHVVVGVEPGQAVLVLQQAAVFARSFGARLVCAFADESRYVIEERPDGSVVSLPIDPDLAEGPPPRFDPALRERIASALAGEDVPWETRYLVGTPADALADLADRLDAAMIVVGSRESGMRGTVREFFNGSIAARLSHRQSRPVVVVPLAPVGRDDRLPWLDAE
jgi:nucleotide-binding universal stress UspA family protein